MKPFVKRYLQGLVIVVVLGAVVPGVLLKLGGLPSAQGIHSALREGTAGWAWICCWLGWASALLASLRDLLRAMASDPLTRARAGMVGTALAALLMSASPVSASPPRLPQVHQLSARAPEPSSNSVKPVDQTAHWIVAPYDSLWSIAEASLDDPTAWTAIWKSNRGEVMNDGRVFVDPSLILPGWSLKLPTGLLKVNPTPNIRPAQGASERQEAPELSVTKTAAAVVAPAQSTKARDGSSKELAVVTPRRWLPGGLSLSGGSVLGLVLLASWLKRRRRSLGDRVYAAWTALDDDLLDQLEALDAIVSEPMVDQVAAALGELERLGLSEKLLALGIGNDGPVAVLDSHEGLGASPEFTSDGHLRLKIQHRGEALELPALLCLGDSERASFVAPLRPGLIVCFSGPGARQVLRAATAQLSWWPWTEDLIVSADIHVVEREVHRRPRASVVFTGDPELLSPESRRELAVVTTVPTQGALQCVLADDGSLSFAGISMRRGDLAPPLLGAAGDLDALSQGRVSEMDLPRLPQLLPTAPMLRLLTQVPRVDGLHEPLAPERSRKAIELLAYLAMHQSSAVPADRLRARIFGRRDGDGSSKTLANTAALLRRALGATKAGSARLPLASAHSGYQLFDVDTDYHRFVQLCAEAELALDAQTRIALHREALSLIEGEPCSLSPSGYQWWDSEGHGAHVGMLAVSAAWSVLDDAESVGSMDLARWAIERARILASHSESLWRAQMVLAGMNQDHDGLLLAWQGCSLLATALEPGARPSAAAEQTMRRVAEGISQGKLAAPLGELGGDTAS